MQIPHSVKCLLPMKNNYYPFFLLVTLLITVVRGNAPAFAQNSPSFLIKGFVIDSATKKPIEFATISILDSEKKVIALTYSDETGLFKSPNVSTGSFYLNLSFIGYIQKTVPFTITSQSTNLDLATIYLRPDITQLKAVTITGSR